MTPHEQIVRLEAKLAATARELERITAELDKAAAEMAAWRRARMPANAALEEAVRIACSRLCPVCGGADQHAHGCTLGEHG